MNYLEIMDDTNDWFIVARVNPSDPNCNDSAENAEEIHNLDDKGNSDRFNKRDSKTTQTLSKECCQIAENTERKQNFLNQTVDVSTNTELLDTSCINKFSDASDKRKLDENIKKRCDSLEVKKKSLKKNYSSFSHFERYLFAAHLSSLIIVALICLLKNLPYSYEVQVADSNYSVTALQKENIFLKKQILNNQRKESRKLTSLMNLLSVIQEENENSTRRYLEQLALYQKKVSYLEEEISSLEAKYNNVTEDNYIVGESENHAKLPNLSANNEKYIERKLDAKTKFCCAVLGFSVLILLLLVFISVSIHQNRSEL